MVKKGGAVVWSFESDYGYPYVGTNQQKQTVLAKAKELGGVAVDPRTGRRIETPKLKTGKAWVSGRPVGENPDRGIRFVLGIMKQAGQRVSEVQSVLFDKAKWSVDKAKGWLRDHGFGTPAVDEGKEFYRFRQKPPRYKEYATVRAGARNPKKKYPPAPKGLSVADKTLLRIAYDTLRMPEPMAGVMGGGIDTHEKARAVIRQLTGKEPKENPKRNPERKGMYKGFYITHRRNLGKWQVYFDHGPRAGEMLSFDSLEAARGYIDSYPARGRGLNPAGYDPAPVEIPAVITHDNMEPLRAALQREPEFQPGPQRINRRGWYRQPVYLEFPTGELAKGGLQSMALVGHRERQSLPIEKGDRFDAQGLEGKVRVEKDLFGALMNMDLLPRGRGQILTRARGLEHNPSVTLRPGTGRWFWKSDWGSGDAPTIEEAKSSAAGQIQRGGGSSRIVWYHYDAGGNLVKKEGAGWGFGQKVHEEYPKKPRRGRGRNPIERASLRKMDQIVIVADEHSGELDPRLGKTGFITEFRNLPGDPDAGAFVRFSDGSGQWVRLSQLRLRRQTGRNARPAGPNPAGGAIWYGSRKQLASLEKLAAKEVDRTGKSIYIMTEKGVLLSRIELGAGSNPEWTAWKVTVRAPGGKLVRWIRFAPDRAFAERSAAEAVREEYGGRGRLLGVEPTADPRSKRNPSEDATLASALAEKFHGAPPKETFEVYEELQERDDLAGLGRLVDLTVVTPTNLEAVIEFPNDAPLVASSPDGGQLFFVGGDQAIDLAPLKMQNGKWRRDSMILGDLKRVTYRTAKAFDKFETLDYFHKVGEKTGVHPVLIYDAVNSKLSVSGGQYEVKAEGIVN